jgi:hypothetical protein
MTSSQLILCKLTRWIGYPSRLVNYKFYRSQTPKPLTWLEVFGELWWTTGSRGLARIGLLLAKMEKLMSEYPIIQEWGYRAFPSYHESCQFSSTRFWTTTKPGCCSLQLATGPQHHDLYSRPITNHRSPKQGTNRTEGRPENSLFSSNQLQQLGS